MENRKIKFVREYESYEKKYDVIYHSRRCVTYSENELPQSVKNFISKAKATKQYDYTSTRKNKNEIIYEAYMKFRVIAKIADSPIMPVKTFFAEKEFEFSVDSNVFGRAYDVRKYFKTTYKTDNVEITRAVQL